MKILEVGSIINITEGDMFKLILLKNPKKKLQELGCHMALCYQELKWFRWWHCIWRTANLITMLPDTETKCRCAKFVSKANHYLTHICMYNVQGCKAIFSQNNNNGKFHQLVVFMPIWHFTIAPWLYIFRPQSRWL